MYTHTREKPFVCGINGCQERFRQRGKRSIHQREAHSKNLCGKRKGDFRNEDSDDCSIGNNPANNTVGRHFNSPTIHSV